MMYLHCIIIMYLLATFVVHVHIIVIINCIIVIVFIKLDYCIYCYFKKLLNLIID